LNTRDLIALAVKKYGTDAAGACING